MPFARTISSALLACAAFAAAPAYAATCQAGGLLCATTMPVGGYCECTAHHDVQSGTVVPTAPRGQRVDATAGGCGTNPNAPGCR